MVLERDAETEEATAVTPFCPLNMSKLAAVGFHACIQKGGWRGVVG